MIGPNSLTLCQDGAEILLWASTVHNSKSRYLRKHRLLNEIPSIRYKIFPAGQWGPQEHSSSPCPPFAGTCPQAWCTSSTQEQATPVRTWVTCLLVEQPNSLDSLSQDSSPQPMPSKLTGGPTAGTYKSQWTSGTQVQATPVRIGPSHTIVNRLQLFRCRPQQSEEQRTPWCNKGQANLQKTNT